MPAKKMVKRANVDYKFLVIGPFCFGKADTEKQAIANAKKNAPSSEKFGNYSVYLVPPDTGVDGLGRIIWKEGTANPIILYKKMKDGKEQPITESM
jgi:hypothetical protein